MWYHDPGLTTCNSSPFSYSAASMHDHGQSSMKSYWIPIEVSIQVWDLFACSKTFCEWQVCSVAFKNNKYYVQGDYSQLLTRLRQFRVPWQSNQHTILLLPYTNHHHDHINLLMKWWRYSDYPHQDQILVLMPLPLCFPYLHTLVVMNNLQNT